MGVRGNRELLLYNSSLQTTEVIYHRVEVTPSSSRNALGL